MGKEGRSDGKKVGESMNWKREAIDKLKNYEAHQKALETIPQEIRRLEIGYTSIRSATTDSTPISGGGSTREDAMLSNIIHRDELERRLQESKLWVGVVDAALGVLDDEERLVLDRFYIHQAKGAARELCERLNVEQSTIYRKRDSALRHFTLALYLRPGARAGAHQERTEGGHGRPIPSRLHGKPEKGRGPPRWRDRR